MISKSPQLRIIQRMRFAMATLLLTGVIRHLALRLKISMAPTTVYRRLSAHMISAGVLSNSSMWRK